MADYRIIFHNNTNAKLQIAEYDNLHKTISKILILESRKVAINNILYRFCTNLELQITPNTYNSIFIITGPNTSCIFDVGDLHGSGTYNINICDKSKNIIEYDLANSTRAEIDYDIEELESVIYEDNKIMLEMQTTKAEINTKLRTYRILCCMFMILTIAFIIIVLYLKK